MWLPKNTLEILLGLRPSAQLGTSILEGKSCSFLTSNSLMESILLGSSSSSFLQLPRLHLHEKPQPSNPPSTICCGLRKSSREPLWRRNVMSTEAIQAVQALKIAKSSQSKDPPSSSSSSPSSRLGEVFSNRIGRLIKGDLVAVLGELQRQNEWEIALQVLFFLLKIWFWLMGCCQFIDICRFSWIGFYWNEVWL